MHELVPLLGFSALAAVIFLPPGYAIGFWFNLLGFRDAGLLGRLVRALPITLAVMPIVWYLGDRIGGQPIGFYAIYLSWAAMATSLLWEIGRLPSLLMGSIKDLLCLQCWLLFPVVWWLSICFSLIDLDINGVLYNALCSYDYAKNVAVVDAMLRTGIPPINPSFYPGKPIEIFYYYFWFLFPYQFAQLMGNLITVAQAVQACTVWGSFGLMSVALMWVEKLDLAALAIDRRRLGRWVIALFLVTGLDIVPIVINGLIGGIHPGGRHWLQHLEWWNNQVGSLWISSLWVPHHLAGLAVCLFGFLFLRPGTTPVTAILAGVAFASALGLSVWITLLAAAILGVWLLIAWGKGWRDEVKSILVAGLVAAAFAGLYLLDLKRANLNQGSAPIRLQIREFDPASFWLYRLGVEDQLRPLVWLLFLPLNYLLEFGVFAIAGWIYLRRRLQNPAAWSRDEWFLATIAGVALFSCTFFVSALRNNDFGWRGMLYVQFVLLFYTALVCDPVLQKAESCNLPRLRIVLFACFLLGLMGNTYDFLQERRNVLHRAARDLRDAHLWLRDNSPRTAIVQHDPILRIEVRENGPRYVLHDVEYFHALYGNRQVVVSDDQYAQLYGVSQPLYADWAKRVVLLFNAAKSWEAMVDDAKNLKVNYVVIRVGDRLWREKSSWVWKETPIYANANVRVFQIPD